MQNPVVEVSGRFLTPVGSHLTYSYTPVAAGHQLIVLGWRYRSTSGMTVSSNRTISWTKEVSKLNTNMVEWWKADSLTGTEAITIELSVTDTTENLSITVVELTGCAAGDWSAFDAGSNNGELEIPAVDIDQWSLVIVGVGFFGTSTTNKNPGSPWTNSKNSGYHQSQVAYLVTDSNTSAKEWTYTVGSSQYWSLVGLVIPLTINGDFFPFLGP